MTTDHIEKFVNALACDLEEGGFRQVSGTTLRRSLTEAVGAALPLLADTGIPTSQRAELAEQQGGALRSFACEAVEYFRERADVVDGDYGSPSPNEEMKLLSEGKAALSATGKQQVGEVQGDAREEFEAWWKSENYNRGALNSWHGNGYNNVGANAAWASWQAAHAATGKQQVGEVQAVAHGWSRA